MSKKILIVDDDPFNLDLLDQELIEEDYTIERASNGEEALQKVESFRPDVILLDYMMPKMNGIEVLKHLRQDERFKTLPVILLTAKGSQEDKAKGLDAGADDYVVKPFSLPELHARMLAVLRRSRLPSPSHESPEFSSGELKINYRSHQVTVAGKEIELTATEFSLLKELSSHSGEVMTHRTLLHTVWGPEYGDEKEYVRVFVNRLRQKLGDDPASPKFIKTEAGVGYQFIKDQ